MLVTHERIGHWARQLRPRFADRPVRLVETRSAADLAAALAGAPWPLAVVDLARRPGAGLDDLERAIRVAPDALVLVLDPGAHEGVAPLAREIGASLVITGPTNPPAVARLLCRWLGLAGRRAEAAGWFPAPPAPPEPEPWD